MNYYFFFIFRSSSQNSKAKISKVEAKPKQTQVVHKPSGVSLREARKQPKKIQKSVQPVSCRLCRKFFVTPTDFSSHMKTEHVDDNLDLFGGLFDEIQPISCRICMKEFNNPSDFNNHVQSSKSCMEKILQKNVSNVWSWPK